MNKADFINLIKNNKYTFVASGMLETIRRNKNYSFDDYVGNSLHIYDPDMQKIYYNLYDNFYAFIKKVDAPVVYFSLTWRTNLDRVKKASAPSTINSDAVNFLNNWRNKQTEHASKIILASSIGSIGDCYKPEQAPTRKESYKHHEWQIEQLINTNIDFLFPATMPSVDEVLGICDVMQDSNFPYIISFVINSSGRILDGTTLEDAFHKIDKEFKKNPPIGYMVNCSYPTFLQTDSLGDYAKERLIGYLANASSKDFSKLESSEELHKDSIDDWVNGMVIIYHTTNIKLLGGCCGTDLSYLEKLYLKLKIISSAKSWTRK